MGVSRSEAAGAVRDEIGARGWTLVQFADRCGLPVSVVASVVDGFGRIPDEAVDGFAKAFGTSTAMWQRLQCDPIPGYDQAVLMVAARLWARSMRLDEVLFEFDGSTHDDLDPHAAARTVERYAASLGWVVGPTQVAPSARPVWFDGRVVPVKWRRCDVGTVDAVVVGLSRERLVRVFAVVPS
jgi:plasmid maintenance system antidote protein VapI